MIAGEDYAKEGVSNDAELATLGQKLPRLYSIADKHNRFRVEKLFNVYCGVVKDYANNGQSLLKLATDNTYRNEQNDECGVLYMSVGPDRYSMYICDSAVNASVTNSRPPNVFIFGIIADTLEQGLDAISSIRQVAKNSLKPRQPLLLLAYKTAAGKGHETDAKLLKELAALSEDLGAYRCLDCSAVNRPTIRTILAMALLAARPYISEFRSLSELKFDDDAATVTQTASVPTLAETPPRKSPHKHKFLARLFPRKSAMSKMCNVQ